MTNLPTDTLIDRLVTDVRPVRPLRAPALRALTALLAIGLVAGLAIVWLGDLEGVGQRAAGREMLLGFELAAMLATGVLAIAGAFFLSVPGSSRRWVAAPVPSLAAWLILSGVGCVDEFVRRGDVGGALSESVECLLFILAASVLLAPILVWRLARARPIDPLPVALLGGLGVAATSALVLTFFHPFAVTFLDLAVHVAAMLVVIAAVGLLHRRVLAPA